MSALFGALSEDRTHDFFLTTWPPEQKLVVVLGFEPSRER